MNDNTHLMNIVTTVLDHAFEGVVVIDEDGRIIYFNEAYCRTKGISQDEAIGRHVTDVIENTRLHEVLKTGMPERGKLQTIAGQDMVVHRIPVWADGRVVSAIGMLMFEGVSDLYEILESIETKRTEGKGHQPVRGRPAPAANRITLSSIVGRSEAMMQTKRFAAKAAKTLAPVLITGESGTGKELFAKAIHHESPFQDGPFVSINSAAIPEHLLEAELFGYEEGAFTGAKKGGKRGLFEEASSGTLFLDEIGDMPLHMQSKILRVLQEKEATRVGGLKPYQTKVRIISATNKNLTEMIRLGTFREDLYYRLNIIPVHIPPLRVRKEDIPLLLSTLMEDVCSGYQLETKQFEAGAIARLTGYDWPGNVREMRNVIEQLVSLEDGTWIRAEQLPAHLTKGRRDPASGSDVSFEEMKDQHRRLERERIQAALEASGGNKALAARTLGIHRSTLYEKLRKYGFS